MPTSSKTEAIDEQLLKKMMGSELRLSTDVTSCLSSYFSFVLEDGMRRAAELAKKEGLTEVKAEHVKAIATGLVLDSS